jgi:hypothetical protein
MDVTNRLNLAEHFKEFHLDDFFPNCKNNFSESVWSDASNFVIAVER